jgi:hypothetical protein
VETRLKIYCDTSTLPGNASEKEQAALKQLTEEHEMFGSHLVRYEAGNTKNVDKRNRLIAEHDALAPIPKDEKLLGFNTQDDGCRGFTSSPIISDVQDEGICAELMARGLDQRDAEHITQAVSNDCDVFLTRDERTIINRHREWLEQRFPKLKVRLPSELLAFGEKTLARS